MRSYKYHPLTRRVCRRPASLWCVFPCGAVLARVRGGPRPFRWVSYLAKREEIRLHRRVHRLMVASEYMRAELLANGFSPDQIEIHPPVPPAAEPSVASSFSDRNLLVFSGQVIRGKGVDMLLRALARVNTPFECVILGDGHHRARCERLCRRLGLAARVSFKGFLPPREVEAHYAEASVALVSSVWPEPFGMVGIEAMRHGLPVVAFDAGGIRDWLCDGETGFLVPWKDVAQYAARVEQLLRDKPLARALGGRGRQFAAERYDRARYVRNLEDLFARVIGEAQAQARA
jgi:glycosyltransferase involved in cell wall biosynthesis